MGENVGLKEIRKVRGNGEWGGSELNGYENVVAGKTLKEIKSILVQRICREGSL